MVSRTDMFRNLVSLATTTTTTTHNPTTFAHSSSGNFPILSEFQKLELLTALKSLKNYEQESKLQVDRRKRLFKLMSWRQQKLCQDVGYLNKLTQVTKAINTNSKFINDVADYCINKYGITYKDFEMIKQTETKGVSASNYRVIEALSHYARDWNSVEELGSELQPIFNYIIKQLTQIIPKEAKSSTCIVVPGSGLGRIAHEIARLGYGSVHAIEYSGLMSSFVDFNYSGNAKNYTIHPYVHTNSDFYTTESQLRSINLSLPVCDKPNCLQLHNQDFQEFSIPSIEKYTHVVVVSVYFLDTAENLMDYLDTIQRLTTSTKSGYWINVGPLKYGTAAQVELNAHELRLVRKKMGWVDIDNQNTLSNPSSIGNTSGLLGYITDVESMWQGFYGLNMFTTKRKEN